MSTILAPQIRLVDVDGYDVPVTEKDAPPVDPADPAEWPAWTDDWSWTTTEPMGPDDDDERWLAENPAPAPAIRTAADLLASVAAHLEGLGLEPEARGDVVTFRFGGHEHELELTDIDAMLESMFRRHQEEDMIAAGLSPG